MQDPEKIARWADNGKIPTTRAESPEEIGRWNVINSLEKKTPKEPSRADTSKLSRSDTAENLAQENIEGVWNTPCKTKETH